MKQDLTYIHKLYNHISVYISTLNVLFHTVEKIDTFGIWQQVKEMIYSFLNPSIRVIAKSESLENAILLEKEINTGNEKHLGAQGS